MKFRYDKTSEELVVTAATRIEYHQMDIWLKRKVKGWKFHPAVKAGVWDGEISYFRDGRINFSLWKECLKGCQEIGASFIMENKEDFPINREVTLEGVQEFCKEFFKNHKVKDKEGKWIPFYPYDHQIESAYKILKNRYCLSEVATSGGKSLIISIVFFYTLKSIEPNAKFLIIVPSINLVTQFYDAIIDFNIGVNQKIDGGNPSPLDIRIEEIMSDRPRKHGADNPNIFIGTYQSLEKWPKEFFEKLHTVATDEAHGAKSKTLISILGKTFRSAYSRFGVSGTFPGEMTCEILTIQSVLGPKINEISAHELKEKGIITPMEIKAVIMNHDNKELKAKLDIIKRGGNGRGAMEVEKAYIHESTKRLDFISKIVQKCDSNTLVLFHSIEYGKKLFEKLKTDCPDKEFSYIDGEIKNKSRESIKGEMEKTDGKVQVLVASFGTLSTGVSINAIFNVIFADSFKSEQIIIQSIGRALRLHSEKKTAFIFDLVDVFDPDSLTNILYKHYVERKSFYTKRQYPHKEIKINL